MTSDLAVDLGEKSYPIHFPSDASAAIREMLATNVAAGRSNILLTDDGVARAQSKFLADTFGATPRLIVPAGERTKCLETFGKVLDFLAANRVNRQGVLWVVGGGVVGDLGGYSAASYLRGISYVQVPTTLLAMVDSSVGGKTGINLTAGKNLVGAFHHPKAVFIGREFLQTLPPREFAAGMAEIVKYGLLGDAALFAQLEQKPVDARSTELADVIRRCCQLKAEIVKADEFERAPEGGRALLNLGHTFGHAVEQVTGYTTYLHGEGVAIGLAAAARLSHKLGLLTPEDITRVEKTVAAHNLPIRLRGPLPLAELQNATTRDKKNRADGVRFVVMPSLGRAATRSGIAPSTVEAVWREVGAT
ncbi:3-dehydroquinate synthase [Oleiharenicola lentus]|uniref:3-dehydroquinate synthase n=1 Tax=Oleiharenicola lentus TaxID=2508720 RepID=A0A4Q1C7N1_9BACT|nr:3-dehydroquinate synthase [Oleiharenicola lentus]RXK54924.1 3-dehydroquinate synthase [Oleiharenicola lentus]